jgi:hypothetical protein
MPLISRKRQIITAECVINTFINPFHKHRKWWFIQNDFLCAYLHTLRCIIVCWTLCWTCNSSPFHLVTDSLDIKYFSTRGHIRSILEYIFSHLTNLKEKAEVWNVSCTIDLCECSASIWHSDPLFHSSIYVLLVSVIYFSTVQKCVIHKL